MPFDTSSSNGDRAKIKIHDLGYLLCGDNLFPFDLIGFAAQSESFGVFLVGFVYFGQFFKTSLYTLISQRPKNTASYKK